MPQFQYKGRSNRGDMMTGVIEAPSMDAVATQLLNSSIIPVDITERTVTDNTLGELWDRINARRPTLTDLILFSRQMYTLLKSVPT